MRVRVRNFKAISEWDTILTGVKQLPDVDLAKLMYCLCHVRVVLRDALNRDDLDVANLFAEQIDTIFGSNWGDFVGAEICVWYTPTNVVLIRFSEEIHIEFSQSMTECLDRLVSFAKGLRLFSMNDGIQGSLHAQVFEKNRLRKEAERMLDDVFGFSLETYLIPAGRVMASMGVSRMKSLWGSLSKDMQIFLQLVDLISLYFREGYCGVPDYMGLRSTFDDLSGVLKEMFGGDYVWGRYCEYLLKGGKEIDLRYAGLNQHALLWVINLLYVLALRCERSILVIEGLDMHLSGDEIDRLFRLIGVFVDKTGSIVLFTTEGENNILQKQKGEHDAEY